MIYQHIDPTYKYDVIADALHARELEHFHYWFDRENFLRILPHAEGDYRANLEQRAAECLERMGHVEQVIEALKSHITEPQEFESAVERAKQRRSQCTETK